MYAFLFPNTKEKVAYLENNISILMMIDFIFMIYGDSWDIL